MDLCFTDDERAFAAEIRAWLAEHLELPPAFASLDDEIAWGRALAGASSRPTGGSASTGPRATAGAAPRRSRSRSSTWSTRGRGRSNPSTASASTSPARRCSRTAPTSRRRAGCRAILDAERDLVPAVQRARARAPTSRRSRTRATPVDGGWLLDGPEGVDVATRSTRAGGSASPAPTPTRRSTAASATSSSTCRRRASRSGRSCRSPARPSSTRCSSTTCSSPTTTSSAG